MNHISSWFYKKHEIEWEFENILVFSLTIKETNAKDQPKYIIMKLINNV